MRTKASSGSCATCGSPMMIGHGHNPFPVGGASTVVANPGVKRK